ncbi:MAG: ATP-binding protein [Saprospiraceae bacterium]
MKNLTLLIVLLAVFPNLLLFCQSDNAISSTPALEYRIEQLNSTIILPELKWIIEEGQEPLSTADLSAQRLKDANLFDLSENPAFDLQSHYNYWFRLRISSAVAIDTFGLALFQNGNCWDSEFTFKSVEAHIQRASDGNKWVGYSGGRLNSTQRDFSTILNPSLIHLASAQNDTLEMWIKLSKGEACRLKVDLHLLSHEQIIKPRTLDFNTVPHILLSGANFALFIIGLLLYLWFRDEVYLWFILFQITLIAFAIPYEFKNEVFTSFFQNSPLAKILWVTFMRMINVFAVFQFGRVFINTKVKFPRVHQIMGVAIWGFVVLSILGVFFRIIPSELAAYWFSMRQLVLAGVFGSLFSCLIYLIFTKDRLAIVYSIGILLPVVIVIHRIIIVNFTNDPGEWEISLVTNVGMVFMMTIALAYRFQKILKERNAAMQASMNAKIQNTEQRLRMDIASRFFSNITHEFRTPLTLILEPVRQLLKKEKVEKKEWGHKLTLVKNNAEKLLHLVSQLLDIAKIDGKKMKLDLRRGNVLEVIQPIFQSFLLLADRKGIRLNLQAEEEIDRFFFDKNKLEKIVFNLLSNALKFTEEGKVILKIRQLPAAPNQSEKQLLIRVQDTGIGIPTEQLPHIFDRFHQVDGSHTRKGEGTGIGLALVKELTELMAGTITVESSEETGSSFIITIPMVAKTTQNLAIVKEDNATEIATSIPAAEVVLLKNEHSKTAQKDKPQPPNENDPRPVLLLVEDNAELRNFIKASLHKEYQVIEATNGQKGIERAKEFIPDLIVSDVMMPKKTGYELTHALKNIELTSHIPIILLTAKSALESKIQGLKTGADAYLTKPFNTEELLIRIEKLIEIRKILQEKYSHGVVTKAPQSEAGFSQIDQDFIKKVSLLVHEEMANPQFSIEALASKIFISRSQLFRKIKALTGSTVVQFVRNIRLDHAKELLQNKEGNVGEVALLVGFNDDRYFSAKFKERFGVAPSAI